MNLYPFIFKRKSTRRYLNEPFDHLEKISFYLKSLKPLYTGIKTEFKIIPGGSVKTCFQRRAPYYIAAFSEHTTGYLTNIGFMLQQVDLYLSSQGIGSCWQGIPKPKKDVLRKSNLEFVILMAFGRADEPVHRRLSDFKRKPLSEITDIKGMDEILEAVRLAPSSTNSQPWYFSGDKTHIHAYCKKLNFLRDRILGKLNQIDMGIALYHLTLALDHHGMKWDIYFDENASATPPGGSIIFHR